jgi:hypothetical protein
MENNLTAGIDLAELGALQMLNQPLPKASVCPLCHTNLNQLVEALKGNPNEQPYLRAYGHVQFDCPHCRVLIREQFVNEFGNWK